MRDSRRLKQVHWILWQHRGPPGRYETQLITSKGERWTVRALFHSSQKCKMGHITVEELLQVGGANIC